MWRQRGPHHPPAGTQPWGVPAVNHRADHVDAGGEWRIHAVLVHPLARQAVGEVHSRRCHLHHGVPRPGLGDRVLTEVEHLLGGTMTLDSPRSLAVGWGDAHVAMLRLHLPVVTGRR